MYQCEDISITREYNQKKIKGFFIILLAMTPLLASCGPSAEVLLEQTVTAKAIVAKTEQAYTLTPTITPTITSTVTPSSTLTPTPTMTETPTPTKVPENNNFKQVVEGEYQGVILKVVLETDKSLDPSIKEIKLNPNYHNIYGQNAKDAILALTANIFYDAWLSTGTETGKGPDTKITFDEFMKLWAEAQKTGDSNLWKTLQLDIKIDIPSDGKYRRVGTKILPMNYGEQTEGFSNIEKFTFVFARPHKIKNVDFHYGAYEDYDIGYAVNLVSTELRYYALQRNDAYPPQGVKLTWVMTAAKYAILGRQGGNGIIGDYSLLKIIYNKNGKAALQMFPQTEYEKKVNP